MDRTKTTINPFGLPNIVIPAEILFNDNLNWREKALFGFLVNLSNNDRGYCWASNRYLAQLIKTRPDTVSSMISNLHKYKYITTQYETRNDGNGSRQVRKIKIDPTYPQTYETLLQEALGRIQTVGEIPKPGRIPKPHRGNTQTPTGKIPNNIDNINRENNIDNNKSLSTQKPSGDNVSKANKKKEEIKQYLPLATKLANIIKQNKKINTSHQRLRSWADEIRKLINRDGASIERVEIALDWYEENIGGAYIPVIESGSSLREKFIKLEDAMKRSGSAPAINKPSTPPEKIIKDHFKSKDLIRAFTQNNYEPAADMLSHLNGEIDKGQLVQTLINLHSQINSQQKDFPHVRGPMTLTRNYIEWIEDNDWITNYSLDMFNMNSKLFSKFRRYRAGLDNMERDPITGKSYRR